MIPLRTELMQEALMSMISKFSTAVPRVISGLLIFIVFWIIASVVAKVLRKALVRLGADRLSEKLTQIDVIQKSNIKLSLSVLVSKIVYYTLILFGALTASSVLGMPEVSDLMSSIIEFVPHLIVGLIVLIIGTLFSDAIRSLLDTTLKSLGIGAAGVISSGIFYFLLINVIISAMGQAKLNTEFLSQNISILIGGVVFAFAIGYGLASKDTMANFITSFYSKDVFNVGDHVTIDGVRGQIVSVSKTTVTLKTENSTVLLPLHKALSEKIEFHN